MFNEINDLFSFQNISWYVCVLPLRACCSAGRIRHGHSDYLVEATKLFTTECVDQLLLFHLTIDFLKSKNYISLKCVLEKI